MLSAKELLLNSLEHFPRWMDIRRKYFSSNGGKILSAQAYEISEIQNEIDEYVKSFCISHYEDKCDKICDFAYKANIGYIEDLSKLKLVSPKLELTTDINKFYNNNGMCFYQDGFLFIKENSERIFYSIDNYTLEATTERMHVWNVYDEFAIFVGIKRYQDETNAELYNRIINTSKYVINSSEDGLKNAIITSLINEVPELTHSDIKFERPTASNLVKYYDKFNTILDKLQEINKDVLKDKSWDIDRWENDFKQIDYIPHIWDYVLSQYINGIGDGDDLKALLIDDTDTTDVEVSFYKKSEELIDAYINNNNISDKINLSLTKYSNTLIPFKADYKITASTAELIKKDINIDVYKNIIGKKDRAIDEILASTNEVDILEAGFLEDNKYYRVKFAPTSKYSCMKINDCYVKDGDEIVNLKKENNDFALTNNILINKKVKRYITTCEGFNSYTNIKNTSSGITINNISTPASVNLNIDNCNDEDLKIDSYCDYSNVLSSNIAMQNFFLDSEDQFYKSDVSSEEKTLSLKLLANGVDITIESGMCNIEVYINDKLESSNVVYEGLFSTKKFSNAKQFKIIITALGFQQTVISKMKYTSYDLTVLLSNGSLKYNETEDLYTLPSNTINSLQIIIRTYTHFSPIIRSLFIGKSIEQDVYITDLIKGSKAKQLVINANCGVSLCESNREFSAIDNNVSITTNYNTHTTYVGKSDNSYVEINLDSYTYIDDISIDIGSYEIITIGNSNKHIIRLSAGKSIKTVSIKGEYKTLDSRLSLFNIISKQVPGYDKQCEIYANKLLKGFAIKTSKGEEHLIKVSTESLGINTENLSSIVISNLPETFECAFELTDSITVIKNTSTSIFENMYMYPKSAQEYIASNSSTLYYQEKDNIDIVNTFNNNYVENSMLIYNVEPAKEGFDICFHNNCKWSIGKKKLKITVSETMSYNTITKSLTLNINISNTVKLDTTYIIDNKETIELAEYLITTNDEECAVIYQSDVNDINYDRGEFITLENDGFNKLKYSHILLVKGVWIVSSNNSYTEISSDKYSIDLTKGIIAWNNLVLENLDDRIYILYSIEKPIALKFNIDYLYKKTQYPIIAYQRINSFLLTDITSSRKIDLSDPEIGDTEFAEDMKKAYMESDVVYAVCSEPSFIAEKWNDYLLINKVVSEKKLALRTGWYYMYGKEYYMYANNKTKNVSNADNVITEEVSKLNQQLRFHKKTNNFVTNSKMQLTSLGDTYSIKDFEILKNLRGSSFADSITACDNYNNWITLGMDMKIKKGLNGLGISFEPNSKFSDSYAILEITDFLVDVSHLSFYKSQSLKAYIGRNTNMDIKFFTDTIAINELIEITDKYDNNIYYTNITKQEGSKYYLVVMNSGIIDDIIIQDSNNINYDIHSKNIDILNLAIPETTEKGNIAKLRIRSDIGNKNNGTEIDNTNCIVNATYVDWNMTKIRNYSTYKEWTSNWDLNDLNIIQLREKAIISAKTTLTNNYGHMVSKPIYIGNPNIIKNIVYKINDIPMDSMTGITVSVLQSKTESGTYINCKHKYNNKSSINYVSDLIYPYIKLSVDIPKNKVISNIEIYVEYKSTDNEFPYEKSYSNGFYLTEVLDSNYSATYKVKSIDLEKVKDSSDIYIRGLRASASSDTWTNWYQIQSKDGIVTNDIVFDDYRFFQIKVQLKNKNSTVKLNSVNLEVIR